VSVPATAVVTRFLTFEVNAQLYALRADEVAEVIRLPAMARVPQGPPALLGVANLRGAVLPVASLGIMLGAMPGGAPGPDASTRAIVLDVGAPVAIVVDAVAALESADAAQIDRPEKDLGTGGNENLLGAFAVAGTQRIARILDIRALLNAAFARRAQAKPQDRPRDSGIHARHHTNSAATIEMLVTFEVAGQEFALPLAAVEEILPAPADITAVARAEAAVLGLTTVRSRLLPLLSLRTLLGFAAPTAADDRQKVVVMKLGDSRVGLVADRARAIVAADSALVDPLPPVLVARTGGESRIRSVYRGEGGQRLISILSPEQMFRNEVMQRLTGIDQGANADQGSSTPAGKELVFLVFRLADDEFALPIDTVVEVAHVPEQITRVPRTPKFLEGVVNLRGEVLPIVDQRRRFEMPSLDATATRRLVVVRTARHRAGLIVDGVSDVLRTTAAQIKPPPDLTDATSRLINGVLNLEQSQRIVLLLDPAELLTRAEQGLLDTFQASRKKANV
jgi:purine-binding chemotaxis protein CheW